MQRIEPNVEWRSTRVANKKKTEKEQAKKRLHRKLFFISKHRPKIGKRGQSPSTVHYRTLQGTFERAFIFVNAGHGLLATSPRIAVRDFASRCIMQVGSSEVYVTRDNSEPAARAYFTMIMEALSRRQLTQIANRHRKCVMRNEIYLN